MSTTSQQKQLDSSTSSTDVTNTLAPVRSPVGKQNSTRQPLLRQLHAAIEMQNALRVDVDHQVRLKRGELERSVSHILGIVDSAVAGELGGPADGGIGQAQAAHVDEMDRVEGVTPVPASPPMTANQRTTYGGCPTSQSVADQFFSRLMGNQKELRDQLLTEVEARFECVRNELHEMLARHIGCTEAQIRIMRDEVDRLTRLYGQRSKLVPAALSPCTAPSVPLHFAGNCDLVIDINDHLTGGMSPCGSSTPDYLSESETFGGRSLPPFDTFRMSQNKRTAAMERLSPVSIVESDNEPIGCGRSRGRVSECSSSSVPSTFVDKRTESPAPVSSLASSVRSEKGCGKVYRLLEGLHRSRAKGVSSSHVPNDGECVGSDEGNASLLRCVEGSDEEMKKNCDENDGNTSCGSANANAEPGKSITRLSLIATSFCEPAVPRPKEISPLEEELSSNHVVESSVGVYSQQQAEDLRRINVEKLLCKQPSALDSAPEKTEDKCVAVKCMPLDGEQPAESRICEEENVLVIPEAVETAHHRVEVETGSKPKEKQLSLTLDSAKSTSNLDANSPKLAPSKLKNKCSTSKEKDISPTMKSDADSAPKKMAVKLSPKASLACDADAKSTSGSEANSPKLTSRNYKKKCSTPKAKDILPTTKSGSDSSKKITVKLAPKAKRSTPSSPSTNTEQMPKLKKPKVSVALKQNISLTAQTTAKTPVKQQKTATASALVPKNGATKLGAKSDSACGKKQSKADSIKTTSASSSCKQVVEDGLEADGRPVTAESNGPTDLSKTREDTFSESENTVDTPERTGGSILSSIRTEDLSTEEDVSSSTVEKDEVPYPAEQSQCTTLSTCKPDQHSGRVGENHAPGISEADTPDLEEDIEQLGRTNATASTAAASTEDVADSSSPIRTWRCSSFPYTVELLPARPLSVCLRMLVFTLLMGDKKAQFVEFVAYSALQLRDPSRPQQLAVVLAAEASAQPVPKPRFDWSTYVKESWDKFEALPADEIKFFGRVTKLAGETLALWAPALACMLLTLADCRWPTATANVGARLALLNERVGDAYSVPAGSLPPPPQGSAFVRKLRQMTGPRPDAELRRTLYAGLIERYEGGDGVTPAGRRLLNWVALNGLRYRGMALLTLVDELLRCYRVPLALLMAATSCTPEMRRSWRSYAVFWVAKRAGRLDARWKYGEAAAAAPEVAAALRFEANYQLCFLLCVLIDVYRVKRRQPPAVLYHRLAKRFVPRCGRRCDNEWRRQAVQVVKKFLLTYA